MAMTHFETIRVIRNIVYTDGTSELNAVTHSWEFPLTMFSEAGIDVANVVVGAAVEYSTASRQGEPLGQHHVQLIRIV